MSEKQLKQAYLNKLRPYFDIEEEVRGAHFSGKKLRIDAVVRPSVEHRSKWKRPDVALGIEFKDTKRFSQNYDTKNYTKWLSQCIDYTNTEWEGYGYLYVLTCPGILCDIRGLSNETFLRNLMGQIKIGELTQTHGGLTMLLHGHHRIWSEQEGVSMGKHWPLERTFGS